MQPTDLPGNIASEKTRREWIGRKLCIMDSSYQVLFLRYDREPRVYQFNRQSLMGFWRTWNAPTSTKLLLAKMCVATEPISWYLRSFRCSNLFFFPFPSVSESRFTWAKLGQESGQSSSTPMTPQRARLYNKKGDASRRCHGNSDPQGWEVERVGRWKSIETKGFYHLPCPNP